MSIDITIEEMETLPAESYELFDIRGEIERAPWNPARIQWQAQQMH